MKKSIALFTSLFVAGLVLVGSSFCFTSCKTETPVGTPEEEKTDTVIPMISEVWLDASHSMRGYVDTKSGDDFLGIIGALGTMSGNQGLALFGNGIGVKEAYSDFKSKLDNKKIEWSRESNFTSLISKAIDNATDSMPKVVFIVTDGIMSGSDVQIHNDSEYNINHRKLLAEEIKSLVEGKPVAIHVAQYSLNFKGTYYCYDNSSKPLNENKRPLYVIAVGPKNQVNKIVTDLFAKKEILKTDNSITFGDINMPYDIRLSAKDKNVLSKEKKSNNYSLNKGYLKENEIQEITFNISVSKLPEYMKNLEYLQQHGHLQFKDGKADAAAYKDITDVEFEYKEGILSFSVVTTLLNKVTLRYVLDYADPSWIEGSSTDDDKKNYNDKTTFNFKYFMNGLSALNPQEHVNDVNKATINIIN